MLGFLMSGCGERIESTSYYYSPSWTKEGQIIFTYGLQSVRKDAIGTQLGSSYTETVMTMSAAGTNESSLFDATGGPPYAMSCSPVTDYVVYMDDLRSGLFGKIVIRNIASGIHRGLEKVELKFNPGIVSFDWSNDGTQLVYCTTQEVHVVSVSGTPDAVVTAEANLEFVTWKYGTKIAFVHGSPEVLSLIKADGTGRVDLTAAASVAKPQISSADTNILYGIAGGNYCRVNVSGASRETVFAGFQGDLPRLSSDANTVVYDKADQSSGIYTIDLTASTIAETKIK